MENTYFDITIIGAGIFGLTSAICLQERGYNCMLLEKSTIPSELAATTDISKVIRMEYGQDEQYMEMMEEALPGWRTWNKEFDYDIFHETGVCMFSQSPMENGGFEWDSFQSLRKRGHKPVRLIKSQISQKFPAWKKSNFMDGFYHALGGYAESAKTLEFLLKKALEIGVVVKELFEVVKLESLHQDSFRISNLKGEEILSQFVIVAAGAWTPYLVPSLQAQMKISGHPVFHLKTEAKDLYDDPHFCVFTADIAKTGWYGFPIHPGKGVVKIANHGIGKALHPINDERKLDPNDFQKLNKFLMRTFPDLLEAKIVYTRRCLYCDTLDGHFWIDWHPEEQNLMVATGGSGHGFKFAPILGDLVADAFERRESKWLNRFAWRDLAIDTTGEEAARYYGNI